jgi:hypothetical protein
LLGLAYGKRYVLDIEMKTDAGAATVRSGWIVRRGEDFPRFTSRFVLRFYRSVGAGLQRRAALRSV